MRKRGVVVSKIQPHHSEVDQVSERADYPFLHLILFFGSPLQFFAPKKKWLIKNG
jgi:hypothetical protein